LHAQAQTTTIADWDFDTLGTIAAPYNTPSATTGTGSASILGMNNSYNGTTSTADGDVTSTPNASTGSGSYAWRIRGTTGNGYSTSAPIGTQGVEFDASTTGFENIQISFDIYFTTAAPAEIQLQYTTDGSTWINASELAYATKSSYILNNSSNPNLVNGTYFYETGGQAWYNELTANLSLASGVANDSSFGIRIVNAATGTAETTSTGAAYGNSSGNWRFDNVTITGTAVPEPSTVALMGLGLAGVAALRRKLKA
jgi:hypothetical protein